MIIYHDDEYDEYVSFPVIGFGPSPFPNYDYVYVWISTPDFDLSLQSEAKEKWVFTGPNIDRVAIDYRGSCGIHLVCPD